VQVVDKKSILSMLWVDSTCATASCLLSAQRATYAISRDHILPFNAFFCKLSKRKMAVSAAWLIYFISVAIICAVIGSTVTFSAITATATIAHKHKLPLPHRHAPPRMPGNASSARWELAS
jgi:amino acid transporter